MGNNLVSKFNMPGQTLQCICGWASLIVPQRGDHYRHVCDDWGIFTLIIRVILLENWVHMARDGMMWFAISSPGMQGQKVR